MSALPIVIAALQANAGVSALAGNRVHAITAPQGETFPSLVVLATSEAEEYGMEGPQDYPEARVTVMCRGQTATDAISLGDAVVSALKLAQGTFAGRAATIWRDAVDSTDYTDDGKVYRRLLGFRVRYC